MQHVWINHDTDLLDVTLHTADSAHLTAGANDAKQRAVALRAHGLRAPPDDQADLARSSTTTATATATAGAAQDEIVHTTANHPWLTTDRGWVLAGDLHSGEPIVREGDAAPATVTALRVVAGVADYYNLTVSVLHTYAVGDGQYVVHNCESYSSADNGQPNANNLSKGSNYYYKGQRYDTATLGNDSYQMKPYGKGSSIGRPDTGDAFPNYIRQTYGAKAWSIAPRGPDGQPTGAGWAYYMQEWEKPGALPMSNHFWGNPFARDPDTGLLGWFIHHH